MTLSLVTIALLTGACGRSGMPPPGAPAEVRTSPGMSAQAKAATAEFWSWFSANAAGIADSRVSTKEVGDRLHRIHRGLWPELGGETAARTFTVTANGDMMLFGLVREVTGQAPAIAGWKVFALRQRQAPLRAVKTATGTVSPDDVWFTASGESGRFAVNLFVRGLNGGNEDDIGSGALALLQQAVGEQDAFGVLALGPISALPAKTPPGARPLGELAAAVDAFKNKPSP